MSLVSFLTGIADAIRSKTGATGEIPAPEFAERILAIETGSSEAPVIEVSNSFTATPGLITATCNGKSATEQLTTRAGGTFRPSTETYTIAIQDDFVIGEMQVEGDADLVAENIKSGVSIFGVEGAMEAGDTIRTNNPQYVVTFEGGITGYVRVPIYNAGVTDISQIKNILLYFKYVLNGTTYYGTIGGVYKMSDTGIYYSTALGSYVVEAGHFSAPALADMSLTVGDGVAYLDIICGHMMWANLTPTSLSVTYARCDYVE